MNILQIEDDIKSLPDQHLMDAMQTGDYPQYLVLSELKRRKDMRDDHAGRMASYNKDNTVADKIMNEASMGMNAGLGALAPQSMQGMPQGMPQNMPTLPQDQGLGQMVPSNMQNMRAGGQIPSYQEGGGVPVAYLAGNQSQAPMMSEDELMRNVLKDAVNTKFNPISPLHYQAQIANRALGNVPVIGNLTNTLANTTGLLSDAGRRMLDKETYQRMFRRRQKEQEIEDNIEDLSNQGRQDMAAGGLVEMANGRGVPYSMMNPSGIGQFYDFYRERMQPTQAELDYQDLMRSYFDPEEMKKRNRTRQGLDLMRAGLAVGTSATPQQLSKNLDPVISSAASGVEARDKEGLMRAKFESDIAKQDRERETDIAELAYKSEQASKLGGYYDRMGSKDDPIIAIGKELAISDPVKYAILEGYDENNQPIYGGPNEAAYQEAGQIKGAGTITSAGIRTQGSQEEQAAELATAYVGSLEGVNKIKALVKQGLTRDEAVDKVKADFIADLKELNLLAGGGQVPALPQDPPSLDLSSRF